MYCSSPHLAQWHGKVHFGIILGWSVLAALALWFVAKNIAGDSPDVVACDLYSCYCVLGYCLLPMVAFSIFSILLPRCHPVGVTTTLSWLRAIFGISQHATVNTLCAETEMKICNRTLINSMVLS